MEIILFIAVLIYFVWDTRNLRAEISELRRVNTELIDKVVHNRQPQRLVKQMERGVTAASATDEGTDEGMGDPVSIAEREAWEHSRPKTPEHLQGTSIATEILDEG